MKVIRLSTSILPLTKLLWTCYYYNRPISNYCLTLMGLLRASSYLRMHFGKI